MTAPVLTPSVDSPLTMKLLPAVLSLTAGSVDVISFLGLDGLFTAHITGNLVILASHIVNSRKAPVAAMLSVPVFIVVLGLTRLLVQLLLLAALFLLCVAAGSRIDPHATSAVLAGMLGVSAMAIQNALVQV